MALDTRNKRASALGRSVRADTVCPLPDGVTDTADRLQIAWLYAGIAASAPIIVITPPDRIFRVGAERRVFLIDSESRVLTIRGDG